MEIAEIFKADASQVFLTKLAQAVPDAYRTAGAAVATQPIGEEERYNVLPWTRRGHVESRLREVAATCGLPTTTEETGFWRHVVVTCGRFRITQTTSIDSERPLRRAGYKCRYADEQKLLPGFEDLARHFDSSDPHLYAVVVHGASVLAVKPEFMTIRFPRPNLDGYHPGQIDLSFYAETSTQDEETPVEEIRFQANPTLKAKKVKDLG